MQLKKTSAASPSAKPRPPDGGRGHARMPRPPASCFSHFHGRHKPGVLEMAALCVQDLGGEDGQRRARAARELALICVHEHGRPNELYPRLVALFVHNSESSPFDDVRRACMDALYLCHEGELLAALHLEGGAPEILHHRDLLVRRLEGRQRH